MDNARAEEQQIVNTLGVELGRLAPTIAATSALGFLIFTLSSWAFARGLMTSLGFPAYLATLKSCIEFLPSIALQYGVTFLCTLTIGIFLGRQRRRRSVHVILLRQCK